MVGGKLVFYSILFLYEIESVVSIVSTCNCCYPYLQYENGTMLPGDQGTLVSQTDGTFVNHPTNPEGYGTMVHHEDGTMVHHGDGTMVQHGDGTMVHHEDEEEGDGKMLRYDTGPGTAISR